MSILIKGMEMPEDGETVTITICGDGIVFEEFKEPGNVFHAVPVPKHGRLIDADALRDNNSSVIEIYNSSVIEINRPDGTILAIDVAIIDDAPTVIEAEPCKEKGE